MESEFMDYASYEANFLDDKSFGEVEAALDDFDQTTASGTEEANPQAIMRTICRVYRMVKPILQSILRIPFVPKKVKRAVQNLMRALDALCALL